MLWLSVRARWRRAFGPCVAVALLIGFAGGFVLAAIAAARHVESAYQTLIEEIDPPDLLVTAGCIGGQQSDITGCQGEALADVPATMTERMAALPVIDRARPVEIIRPYLVDTAGEPLLATSDNSTGCFEGDRDVGAHTLAEGGPLDQAIPFRLDGDMPASNSDGVVLSGATATRVSLGIGDVIRVAGFCSGDGEPVEIETPLDLRITGLALGAFDVEPPGTNRSFESMYISSTAFEALRSGGARALGGAAVWLDHKASPDAVEEALNDSSIILDLRATTATLDDALETDSRLLSLLGAIAVATGVLLLVPIISRNLRDTADPHATIAALGATPRQLAQRDVAHVGVLAVVGALIAATLAIPISLVMPIGLGEKIYPQPQALVDWLVLAVGTAAIVLLVFAMAAASVVHSMSRRTIRATTPHKVIGLSMRPATGTGVLTAIGRPAGGRQASPWPSVISTTVAAIVCLAGMTYLTGLRHLQQTPRLVGWNWDALVWAEGGLTSDDITQLSAAISNVDGVDAVTRGWIYPPAFVHEVGSHVETWPWSFSTGVGAITPAMLIGTARAGPTRLPSTRCWQTSPVSRWATS